MYDLAARSSSNFIIILIDILTPMDEMLNRTPESHELLLANLHLGHGSTTCSVYVLPIEFQGDSYHFGQETVTCLVVSPLRAWSMTFANIFDF